MKAILPKTEVSNARQPGNKETTGTIVVIGCKANKMQELITVHFYMGRSSQASVVYCNIWVHGKNYWISGKGQAGGWGYHRQSAAFQDALSSAQVKLVGNPYKGMEKTYEVYNRETQKTKVIKQDFTKECHIGGCGDTAIDDALKAIAFELGYKNILITKG